ncbi:MAG: ABC transporter ATP-binding protein/permease [Chitinophagaceae bacterium]|nr:ABC transporter ATP-binding protein/permease [Chitinophagaceae bacterium]
MNAEKKITFNLGILKRILRFAAPYRKTFWISVGLAILLAVVTPIRPLLIQITVDQYISRSLVQMLLFITFIQLLLIAAETFIRFYFTYLTASLGQSVVKDLRLQVYKKIIRLQTAQFDKTPVGTLTTRTINDVESIHDIFSDGLVPIIADLLSIFFVLTYMFWANWKLTLISLIPFPFLLIATYYFKESVNRSFYKVRNAVAQLNAFVQEHLTGLNVIQAFTAENNEFEKFKKINKAHRQANIKALFAYSVFFPIVEIVLALSIGLIVWWTSGDALRTQVSQQGIVISFILCLNLLFRPLRILADKFNVLQMGIIAGERIFQVLDNPDTEAEQGKIVKNSIEGKIEFQNVWFAYRNNHYVLKNVSFNVNPGETVAIVGHTGSGKSTLIHLLNRLYPLEQGVIKLDGIPIQEYKTECLRRHIGVVLQDVFLFSGSVLDNITLHNPEITEEQVKEAARLIDIHDFIMKLPGGYHYHVKERGATLSLGQRQLISFIRAVLYQPSVLVLDEATSSVDPETEKLIQLATEKLIKNRTSLIIAHRLSTIQKADRILVLDKGELIESGTHEQLIKLNGHYASLYETQFRKQISLAQQA